MLADGGKESGFLVARRMSNDFRILFSAGAEMEEQRSVAAVIKNHVGVAAVRPLKDAVRIGPVLLDRLALARENRDAILHNGGGGVILRGEDVAARPANFGAQCRQGFNKNRRLNGHVQRPHNAGTF